MSVIPSENEDAIVLQSVGKMYRLYRRPADKLIDAFGLNRWLFRRENNFQKFWALRDLNLVVKRGERLGIIGRNGAGKSTLLKIITNNVTPTEGQLTIRGKIQALMELGIGFHPDFTGRQNIYASLAYQGLTPAQIQDKMDEIIDFAELGEFIEQPLKTYSAGMSARLAFSVSTSIEPEILIIDEVLGAGDAYFAGKCFERMRSLTEETGATVLFVSHDLGSVQHLCTRVIWIDRGRIIADDAPLQVTKAYYASILMQDEHRLTRRNERRINRSLDEASPKLSGDLLGRLIVSDASQPGLKHPVRRLSLHTKAHQQILVEPGTPMDNDSSQPAYLLTDPLYMCWGEPVKYLGSRVRCVENTGGSYGHAPFVFSIPNVVKPEDELTLKIEHAAKDGEEIRVEIYNGHAYQVLGNLQPSPDQWIIQSWTIPAKIVLTEEASQPQKTIPEDVTPGQTLPVKSESDDSQKESIQQTGKIILKQLSIDRYASIFAEILNVETRDKNRQSKVIFAANEEVYINVTAVINQFIPICGFSLTIYSLNGVVIANLFWPFKNGLKNGEQSWEISIKKLNLHQGEYVISCGIIREYATSSNENIEFYCRWSRAISFRIDEYYIGNTPLGLVQMDTIPPMGGELDSSLKIMG